jgi:phage terminase large subunit-like protein
MQALVPSDARARKYFEWLREARGQQVRPPGDWFVWLLLAGRGFGKTRTAAEDVAWYGTSHPGANIAIVAETFADGRDVCVEGPAGLLGCLPEEYIEHWNRSIGELFLTNRTKYKIFSGDKPDSLRGYEHDIAWVDELAKFRYARETWTQLMLGLRGGEDPRCIVTTTPKPIALLKELMERDNVYVTRGSTFDNAANLAEPFLEEIRQRYEGTRVGQQELYGMYLEDIPGALWTRKQIDEGRVSEAEAPHLARVVVAIDPAMTSGEDADETGIVVAAKGTDGRGYVLADRTCRATPDQWARRRGYEVRPWYAADVLWA